MSEREREREREKERIRRVEVVGDAAGRGDANVVIEGKRKRKRKERKRGVSNLWMVGARCARLIQRRKRGSAADVCYDVPYTPYRPDCRVYVRSFGGVR